MTASASICTISSSNDSSSNDKKPYKDDALVNAVMLLQRRVFQLQANELQELMTNQRQVVGDATVFDDVVMDDVTTALGDRYLNDELHQQKRTIDDIEVVLLGILDSDGNLSLTSRLSQLIILMTRVTRIDHRVLCLQVLLSRTSLHCLKMFVIQGGLKLLKRWMKTAVDEECIDELRSIISLCMKLPFESEYVKSSEIGKSIKKLLKHTCSDGRDMSLLYHDVNSLIELWKGKLKLPSEIEAELKEGSVDIEFPDIASLLSDKLVKDRGMPKEVVKPKIVPVPVPASVAQPAVTSSSSSVVATSAAAVSVKPKESKSGSIQVADDTHATTAAVAVAKPVTPTVAKPVTPTVAKPLVTGKTVSSMLAAAKQQAAIPISIDDTVVHVMDNTSISDDLSSIDVASNATNSASQQSKKKPRFDIAAEAKKKLNKIEAAEHADLDLYYRSMDSMSGGNAISIPTKSCLKRKKADDSDGNGSKRVKQGVQWLDESGGSLRDVLIFESDAIEESSSRKKRDLKNFNEDVKREKESEKKIHASQIREAMQNTIAWYRPVQLKLSDEIIENSYNPVVSPECELQLKRHSLVVEMRYLDDSLIPLDPEMCVSERFDLSGLPIIDIPWEIPGAPVDDDAAATAFIAVHNPAISEPVGTTSSGSGGYSNDNNIIYHNGSITINPEIYQQLDPDIMQMLSVDQSLINQIINIDGSINEAMISMLRMNNPNKVQQQQQFVPQQQPVQYTNQLRPPVQFMHQQQPQQQLIYPSMQLPQQQQHVPYGLQPVQMMQMPPQMQQPQTPQILYDVYGNPINYNHQIPTLLHHPQQQAPILTTSIMQQQQHLQQRPIINIPVLAPPTMSTPATVGVTNSRSAQPCKFFNTPKGCSNGNRCNFAHVR